IRVDEGVVVFGVPRQLRAPAERQFRNAAETIREALSRRLGSVPRFWLEDADDFATTARSVGGPGPTEDQAAEPADDIDPGELVDAEIAGPAVSSVGLLEQELGATVVEEVHRE